MKRNTIVLAIAFGMIMLLFTVNTTPAAEILTVEDFKQKIVTIDQLVKTADNAIFLFDASRSTNRPFKNTGMTHIEAAAKIFKERNSWFPEMGHNFGLYLYSPFREIYPMQPYDRVKFASAIAQMPAKGSGPALLMQALVKIEPVLQGVFGHTKVFLFTDGTFTKFEGFKEPRVKVKELSEKYDVCFYIISSADTATNRQILKRAAAVNPCSRLIPFEFFLNRPEYNTGALFKVKSTDFLVTLTEKRIVGLRADNVLFEFDSADIQPAYRDEIDAIGNYLSQNSSAFVVLNGHTDSTGPKAYNIGLSRRRAESVAAYLMGNYEVERHRIVMLWYGDFDPVAGNDTPQGRAKNRRVEMAVGL